MIKITIKLFELFLLRQFNSMMIEAILLFPVTTNSCWKKYMVASILMVIYLNIWFSDLWDNISWGSNNPIYHECIICDCFYLPKRKNNKKIFINKSFDDQSMKRFHDIIKNVVPRSIIIFSNENIVFINAVSSHLLNGSNETAIEQSLKNIKIFHLKKMNSNQ